MSDIRLSLCIPTYNFGAFLGETLEALATQSDASDEVVVVDGASTDNTADVVRGFRGRIPNLSYHLLPAKGGIDKDLAETVGRARGEYCWLLSSDDVPTPGALNRVRQEIASQGSVYLGNRIECDRHLTPLRTGRWLSSSVVERNFRFSSSSSWVDYCRRAESIGALFSFISSIIVRRDAWRETAIHDGAMGTNYAHVARLIAILQRGGTLTYIPEALVYCRGDNDSFRNGGIARRYMIDFKGYDLLSTLLFDDPAVRHSFRDVVRREHRWYFLTQVRRELAERGEAWSDVRAVLEHFGYSRRELFLIDQLGSSRVAMGLARRLRRTYKVLRSLLAGSRRRGSAGRSSR